MGIGILGEQASGAYGTHSSSKACAEPLIRACRSAFFDAAGTAIVSVPSGNVVGGGAWATGRLTPDTVKAMSAGVPDRIKDPNRARQRLGFRTRLDMSETRGSVVDWHRVVDRRESALAVAYRQIADFEVCVNAV